MHTHNHRSAWRRIHILPLALLLAATGCGNDPQVDPPSASVDGSSRPPAEQPDVAGDAVPVSTTSGAAGSRQARLKQFPEVVIKTSLGNVHVRLDREKAPLTVENFLENYVERGFYDQTIFHYVDDGFMLAAGGYTAELEAKPTRAEIRNEAHNGLSNGRGTIAMARHPDYKHSATSQFFINLADNTMLDHQQGDEDETYGYCVFGQIIEGMDVIDRIARVEVDDQGQFPKVPVAPVVIETIERTDY